MLDIKPYSEDLQDILQGATEDKLPYIGKKPPKMSDENWDKIRYRLPTVKFIAHYFSEWEGFFQKLTPAQVGYLLMLCDGMFSKSGGRLALNNRTLTIVNSYLFAETEDADAVRDFLKKMFNLQVLAVATDEKDGQKYIVCPRFQPRLDEAYFATCAKAAGGTTSKTGGANSTRQQTAEGALDEWRGEKDVAIPF